jgi:NitT/TauT family transport system permease protein
MKSCCRWQRSIAWKIKEADSNLYSLSSPFFLAAVSVGIGFGWKSGIAAEVIGIPAGSIGRMLYEAKLYVMTKELLAWTVVIIIISVIFEKSVLVLLRLFHRERRS